MLGDAPFRIGTGAGFSADRLDPAVELVEHGRLDAIVFECLGERTLAFGRRDREHDPERGYNPWLERRMRAMLPLCRRHRTRLITNMGVANPEAAAARTVAVARAAGLAGLKVAAVLGDEVTDLIHPDTPLEEPGRTVAALGRRVLSANAYLGADALLPALEADADVVITGRVADPSLFLAPLRHHFGWGADDWQHLGAGTAVGHLLECAAQVTGGYFADPGFKEVPGLARVGFPLAEVTADGRAVITKLPRAGGRVDLATVREQLLYEVHDPAAYLTPDVTADFAAARLAVAGSDRVAISGARGRPKPDTLKVTVAFDGGLLAEAEISYAGPGAGDRARLAGEVVEERMVAVHGSHGPRRIDLVGISALHRGATGRPPPSEPVDVRLRCAQRTASREEAELLLWEVESLLTCGPAGGGGYRGHITPSVMTFSTYLGREQIRPRVEVLTA